MDKIIVRGGKRLKGKVKIGGAKNAVLPVMSACLLCRGVSVIENVPGLRDVRTMGAVLERLGAKVKFDDHTLEVEKFLSHTHQVFRAPLPAHSQIDQLRHGARLYRAFDQELAQSQGVVDALVVLEIIGQFGFACANMSVKGFVITQLRVWQAIARPVAQGIQVASASVRGGIVDSYTNEGPGIMLRNFQPFYVNRKILCPFSQPLRSSPHAFGQQVSQSLSVGNLVN